MFKLGSFFPNSRNLPNRYYFSFTNFDEIISPVLKAQASPLISTMVWNTF